MRSWSRPITHTIIIVALAAGGNWLWVQHARSWDLGQRSPLLSYDAAQYALAARELATHGRLATTYALPIELAKHPSPPWPLALVQPGLVVGEAMIYRLASPKLRMVEGRLMDTLRPDQREWIVLVIPFACFIVTAIAIAFGVSRLLRQYAPDRSVAARGLAGFLVGAAFLLDPEAQHFAVGGFTELPFTLGLMAAVVGLALGAAPRRPLIFGLLLGLTGAFRGNMLWLAPILAMAGAGTADPGQRVRVALRIMIGFAIPLAPWWLYKWHSFGTPTWDLSAYSVWDGVQGRTWFSLFHLPETPAVPRGGEAAWLLVQKLGRNLPGVLAALATGVRPLLIGALVLWLWLAPTAPRALRLAAASVLALTGATVIVTALTVPQLRYLFPTRVVMEAAGTLALFALIMRAPLSVLARRAVITLAALVVLVWGARETRVGNIEARETSQQRGMPNTLTLLRIASMMSREIAHDEPVMSNLGPSLAWEARRPVIHLANSPDDLTACRRKMDFRNVLLVFRDAQHAWPAWQSVIEHPQDAPHRVEWAVHRVRRYDSADGFILIWLELSPLGPEMAGL